MEPEEEVVSIRYIARRRSLAELFCPRDSRTEWSYCMKYRLMWQSGPLLLIVVKSSNIVPAFVQAGVRS